MSEPEHIRITRDDVFSPKVDEVLAREGSFGMRPDQFMGKETEKRSGIARVLYSSIFYTALAGGLGVCIGWLIVEPFISDKAMAGAEEGGFFEGALGALLLWPIIAGLGALFVGCVEGLAGRNWTRAAIGGVIGLGIGFGGAFVLNFVAGILYSVTVLLVMKVGDPPHGQQYFTADDCNKIGYLVWMVGRAVAWAPMGIAVGLGPAIHMRSKKLAFNGIVGGLLGAFLGGLLFNPLASIFPGDDAWISRGFGFTAIGLGAGVMIGLVENLAKTAWLYVQAGALAGKQFIIYKNPTVLGSSPKCEIYLFKDEAIEPKHAAIHVFGNRHEIEDLDTPAGTFVNGKKVTRQPLKSGDRIYVGETVLDFSERESE
jgi:hypothetical protein